MPPFYNFSRILFKAAIHTSSSFGLLWASIKLKTLKTMGECTYSSQKYYYAHTCMNIRIKSAFQVTST